MDKVAGGIWPGKLQMQFRSPMLNVCVVGGNDDMDLGLVASGEHQHCHSFLRKQTPRERILETRDWKKEIGN